MRQAPPAARCFGRFRRSGSQARDLVDARAIQRTRATRSDESARCRHPAVHLPVDPTMLKSSCRGRSSPVSDSVSRFCICIYVALAIALAACSVLPTDSTLPLGAYAARPESVALANPEQTKLGQQIEPRVREHAGISGFRLISSGVACFRARMEMAALAEKTLDAQYFAIQGDDTGSLFIQGVLDAAALSGAMRKSARSPRIRTSSCASSIHSATADRSNSCARPNSR